MRWDQLIDAYEKGLSKGGIAYDKARTDLLRTVRSYAKTPFRQRRCASRSGCSG